MILSPMVTYRVQKNIEKIYSVKLNCKKYYNYFSGYDLAENVFLHYLIANSDRHNIYKYFIKYINIEDDVLKSINYSIANESIINVKICILHQLCKNILMIMLVSIIAIPFIVHFFN